MHRSITSFILILSVFISAQTLDSIALDTAKTFKTLNSALKNKEEAYILDLSKNKLSDFPMEIFQLKNLNVLILKRNKIKALPDSFHLLPHLQIINFERNKIDTLPPSLFLCKDLKEIHVGMNMIRSIPDSIAQLQQLEVLDMWSNDLSNYSAELQNLKKLKFFDIRAIIINDEIKSMLSEWLPDTKIEASPSCGCDL